MAANKQGKMQNLINYRMRITLDDGRQMAGQMLAFDKHMNLVLADTEEFRRVRRKPTKPTVPGSTAPATVETEEKRSLGLAIIRGTHIISCQVEGPPPADPSARLGTSAPGGLGNAAATLSAGPGISKPAGRGLPIGLTGPAAGVAGFGGAAFPPPGMAGRGGPMGGPPGFTGAPPSAFGGPPGGPAPHLQLGFPARQVSQDHLEAAVASLQLTSMGVKQVIEPNWSTAAGDVAPV
ncbi:hypothetical protein LTR28_009416 [Elasticomyces elasticus]|nr:hypothetical protein LTR28_009416 [Elasticomyces elasticus]